MMGMREGLLIDTVRGPSFDALDFVAHEPVPVHEPIGRRDVFRRRWDLVGFEHELVIHTDEDGTRWQCLGDKLCIYERASEQPDGEPERVTVRRPCNWRAV